MSWKFYDNSGRLKTASRTIKSGINFIIDGGGSEIVSGIKGQIVIPFNCTITEVELLGDQTGTLSVNIWKDNYTNYPPTIADSITAATPPTITSGIKYVDTSLTGWNKSLSENDILTITTTSGVLISLATLFLKVER